MATNKAKTTGKRQDGRAAGQARRQPETAPAATAARAAEAAAKAAATPAALTEGPAKEAAKAAADQVTAAVQTGEAAAERMAETVEKTAAAAAAETQSALAAAQTAAGHAVAGYDGLLTGQREMLDAWMTSGTAFARGMQALVDCLAEYGEGFAEDTAATLYEASRAGSAEELLKLQADHLQTRYRNVVGIASRFSEHALRLGSDVVDPLSTGMARFFDSAAAPLDR